MFFIIIIIIYENKTYFIFIIIKVTLNLLSKKSNYTFLIKKT